MSVSAGTNKLHYALKTLLVHWDESEAGWRDQVRRDFEKNHIAPLESQVQATMRAMRQLTDVLAKVRRDCTEREDW